MSSHFSVECSILCPPCFICNPPPSHHEYYHLSRYSRSAQDSILLYDAHSFVSKEAFARLHAFIEVVCSECAARYSHPVITDTAGLLHLHLCWSLHIPEQNGLVWWMVIIWREKKLLFFFLAPNSPFWDLFTWRPKRKIQNMIHALLRGVRNFREQLLIIDMKLLSNIRVGWAVAYSAPL